MKPFFIVYISHFFLISTLVFISSFSIHAQEKEFYLRFDEYSMVKNPSQIDQSGWKCKGSAGFPNSANLQVQLLYITPAVSVTLTQKYCEVKDGKWETLLGYFSKKLPPGKYRILVFFSPQEQNQNIHASFVKESVSFEIGTDAEYRQLWKKQTFFLENLLQETENLWLIAIRDYQIARVKADIHLWNLGVANRKNEIKRLRHLEEQFYKEYECSLFPITGRNIFPLFNLIDFFEETAEESLRLKSYKMLSSRTIEFYKYYPEAWVQFRYEAVFLSPGTEMLQLEMAFALNQIDAKVEESLSREKKKGNGQISAKGALEAKGTLALFLPKNKRLMKELACVLIQVERLHAQMGRFSSVRDNFLQESNIWLLDIRKLLYEVEMLYAFAKDQEIDIVELPRLRKSATAPYIFYSLLRSLFQNWMKADGKCGITRHAINNSPYFEELWSALLKEFRTRRVFYSAIKTDIAWMQQIVQEYEKALKADLAFDDKIQDWNARIVEQQKVARLLMKMENLQDGEVVLARYNTLCARTISLLISAESKGEEVEKIVNELESLKNALNGLK